MLSFLVVPSLTLVTGAHAATLDDAWIAAQDHSSDLAVITERRVQSDQGHASAWALVSPKISVGGNYTVNQRETAFDTSKLFPADVVGLIEQMSGEPLDFGAPLVINKRQYFDAYLTVTQTLFSMQAFPHVLASDANRRSGRQTEEADRAQLKLAVARVYWGALVARQGEALAKDSLELAQQQAEVAGHLADAGTTTDQARLQAKIAVSRAQRDVLAAHARAAAAAEALQRVTGLDADAELDVPALPEIPAATLDDALAMSASRPEIHAADETAKATRLQSTTTALGWLPRIDGRFTEAWSQNTGFNGEDTNWTLVVSGTWTAWDGGARIADQNRALSAARMATALAESERDVVRGEVVNSWEQWQRARQSLASAREERGYAEENVRLANISLSAGVISFVDAQAAIVGLSAARVAELNERMSVDIGARALLVSIGEY